MTVGTFQRVLCLMSQHLKLCSLEQLRGVKVYSMQIQEQSSIMRFRSFQAGFWDVFKNVWIFARNIFLFATLKHPENNFGDS